MWTILQIILFPQFRHPGEKSNGRITHIRENRGRFIRLAVIAALLPTNLLWAPSTRAQDRWEVFFPLLVDFPGWQGNKPFGLTMQAQGLVGAGREYQRGDARLVASVGAA